jgi:hypothetical protein
LNSVARVISTTGTSSFIDVIPSDGRNELEVIDAEILSGDGRLKGTYEMSLSGYSALDWREHFCEKPEKLFDDQVKEWFANWETANHVILNKNDNIEAPVKFKCQFESEGQASSQDMLYIDLMRPQSGFTRSISPLLPQSLSSGNSDYRRVIKLKRYPRGNR